MSSSICGSTWDVSCSYLFVLPRWHAPPSSAVEGIRTVGKLVHEKALMNAISIESCSSNMEKAYAGAQQLQGGDENWVACITSGFIR